ncbi:hypothetical protein JKP88DRAFT_266220 [Tribonema minus]|uniref:Uncharacterized protein n=1 Tax=Tribonema minus TaxID=303371 RepID=A0A836CP27_9STRA|nr:hypothetical protein JKP88DRAFT_266220 [Tribonema minus]
MKRTVHEAKAMFGTFKADDLDGEIGQGAQIAWNTGIAEVDLPIDVKMRNIEATKAARAAFIARTRRGGGGGGGGGAARGDEAAEAPSELIGSFTANYSHHSKEYAAKMREREMARQKEMAVAAGGPAAAVVMAPTAAGVGEGAGGDRGKEGGGQGGNRRTKDFSNDDKVYERFKKRTRRF